MPVWSYILIGIFLLIILLLSLKVKLIIAYKSNFSVYLKILFIKVRLYPEKEKKKGKSKKKKIEEKSPPKKDVVAVDDDKKEPSVLKILLEMKSVISKLISKFFDKIHFKFIKVHASIGCDNASKTALAYGTVVQTTSYIIELLNNISNVDMNRSSDIDIRPDFVSQKSWLELNCTVYSRVFSLLKIGISALKAIFIFKSKQEQLMEANNGTIKTK